MLTYRMKSCSQLSACSLVPGLTFVRTISADLRSRDDVLNRKDTLHPMVVLLSDQEYFLHFFKET